MIGSIDDLPLDHTQVLQLLRTNNYLPEVFKSSMQNVTTLQQLFSRFEVQCPSLESVEIIVVGRITTLKHCGKEPHQIEARCSEVILAIEDLGLLFPYRILTKTEAMACVIKIGPQSPDLMKTVAFWLCLSNSGEKLMNASLYEHLNEVQNMNVESRMADMQHTAPPSVKNNMTFTKTDAGTSQTGKGLASSRGAAQKGAKVPSGTQRTNKDWLHVTCNVCAKHHKEPYFNCPKLNSLQQKQGKFANGFEKCLFAKNSTGVCTSPHQPCHLLPTNDPKVKVNLLCLDHALMHFRLCTMCPPRQVPTRAQKVMLHFQKVQLKQSLVAGLKKAQSSSNGFFSCRR